MNTIKENPFRTLGLFGNSSEKELQRQIATIKRFAEVGRIKAFEYDFPFFGEVIRSTEKVNEAASRIEQAKNKVLYALFWFINSGHIDELALSNLKEGNIQKAIEIWDRTLKDVAVTSKNFASISNLSTLKLGIVTRNGSFDPEMFSASVDLKAKLLLSEIFSNFIANIIGEGISINREIVLKEFADEILQIAKPYLNKPKGLKSSQLINAFNLFPNEIKQYVSGKFTDRPLSNIENQIEIAKQKRTDNPKDAEEYGEELYISTKVDLVFLKDVWGSNNVQYQMIVNKLANEILQCAIDFFVEYRERDEYDPGEPAMKVMKMAKAINPNGQIKSRLDENIENLSDWIKDKPEREKLQKIRVNIDTIDGSLKKFNSLSNSIKNANQLFLTAKPHLIKIKDILGANDQLYVNISSAVVQNILNMLVVTVNEQIEQFQKSSYRGIFNPYSDHLEETISSALEATYLLGDLKMDSEQRKNYDKNLEGIKSLAKQLEIPTISPKEKIVKEIFDAEREIDRINLKAINNDKLLEAREKLKELSGWTLFRSKEKRENEILEQKIYINNLIRLGEQEKANNIRIQQTKIENLRAKLKEFTL